MALWALSALSALLAGCGSGGGDAKLLASESGNASSDMVCPAADMQCSGGAILRVDNGIGLTASGVQTYATSTNDLMPNNPAPGSAWGLMPASGGIAEVRVTRTPSGETTGVTLLLSKLGISWDGKTDRPQIIETFEKRQGRVQLDSKGLVTFSALPPASDLNFYDYWKKGALGTQSHYANNIYFPKNGEMPCATTDHCSTIETDGIHTSAGDWRMGGIDPDNVWGTRLHEDGATQAGLGQDASGNLILLPASQSVGVPYPGFKGFRNYHQWSFAHANLANWITQDTVMIEEWAQGAGSEHNKMRRGFVAFGALTRASLIPAAGTVRYAGVLRGWFSYQKTEDSYPIAGEVTALVDFAKHTLTLTFSGTRIDEGTMDTIPVSLTSTLPLSSAQLANYATGAASNDALAGGLSARFFGPVATGSSGHGPAELAGTFQLQAQGEGPSAIGGFLLKRL
jgi:hypothetical protein